MSDFRHQTLKSERSFVAHLISRRTFAKIITTTGVAGTALLDTMLAEVQDRGTISSGSVKAFLELADLKLNEEQMNSVKSPLERYLESMKKIRDRELPQALEPATMFRVKR